VLEFLERHFAYCRRIANTTFIGQAVAVQHSSRCEYVGSHFFGMIVLVIAAGIVLLAIGSAVRFTIVASAVRLRSI
jgi:hypothetical protein